MSALDQFWNFKLVLKERLDDDDLPSTSDGGGADSINSTTFVNPAELGVVVSSVRQAEERYEHEAPATAPYLTALDVGQQTVQEDTTKEQPFKLPQPSELDKMSVEELRALRRRLALRVHPDRVGIETDGRTDDTMGRCNQLIDEAISRKKSRPRSGLWGRRTGP